MLVFETCNKQCRRGRIVSIITSVFIYFESLGMLFVWSRSSVFEGKWFSESLRPLLKHLFLRVLGNSNVMCFCFIEKNTA